MDRYLDSLMVLKKQKSRDRYPFRGNYSFWIRDSETRNRVIIVMKMKISLQ